MSESDRKLAQDLVDAVAKQDPEYADGGEGVILAEGPILERLDVPLDETERGLTRSAVEQIEAFVSRSLGRTWTYGGFSEGSE